MSQIWSYASIGKILAMVALAILGIAILAQRFRANPERDERRALSAFSDAWDLSLDEISTLSRVRESRLCDAMVRLEGRGFVEKYESERALGRIVRYVLTNDGREAVYELERSKLEAG